MPTVEPQQSKLVLVTGANGYLALWVVRTLLEQGYRVRGAVRSDAKGKRFLETFKNYSDKVEYVIVEDITKDHAFDEVVKDADAIEHIASPVFSTSDDPDELIKPAVNGTLGLLNSILKFGKNVKRVVITSSVASILGNVTKPNTVFDEMNWANEAIKNVKENGRNTPFMERYKASKALAEKGAWEFCERHKAEIGWDLVTLQPPFILGPPLQEVETPEDLNVSLDTFYKAICTDQEDATLQRSYTYVHVKDIAKAHVDALKVAAAGGERMIIAAGAITWQHTRNLARILRPELYTNGMLPIGNVNIENTIQWTYSAEKSRRILDFSYGTLEDIINDILEDFMSRGWLKEGSFRSS